MPISSVRVVTNVDDEFIWNSLRRFQNVQRVSELIREQKCISGRQLQLAKKQALQIRQCLLQAREYFQAAKAVSLATRPLLLYYGMLSLALAEVLFKQDGTSSIDYARQSHRHHGLIAIVKDRPAKYKELLGSAAQVLCKPAHNSSSERYGSFELWHSSARENPICCRAEFRKPNGAMRTSTVVIASARDERMPALRTSGITLLDCFLSSPIMRSILEDLGITPNWVRARPRFNSMPDGTCILTLALQSAPIHSLQSIQDKLLFEPSAINYIDVIPAESEASILQVNWKDGEAQPRFSWPNAIQLDDEDTYFCTNNDALNEFGVYFVGLFLLGNLARYYPDYWVDEVDTSSELAIAAHTFVAMAEARAPLLTLSELARVWYLVG